jgi:hypothetical protein
MRKSRILSLILPVFAATVTLILSAQVVNAEPSSNDHAAPTKPGARTEGSRVASTPRPMPTLASDAHAAPTAPGARIVNK